MSCLSDETLAAWISGELPAPELKAVEGHCADCASCRGVAVATMGLVPRPAATLGAVGATIGRYRVDATLGHGSMGVVVRGYDPILERDVALKMINATTTTADQRDRMLREAKLLALIDHPHVVRVHDAGLVDGEVFVAMEHITGSTLGRWLEDAPRSLGARLEVLAGVGAGIAAIHAAGVVHRDIKPDNILVRDHRGVIVDFGLARSAGVTAGAAGSGIAGTLGFLAPEVRGGEPATERSDQFAWWTVVADALRDAPMSGRRRGRLDRAIARGTATDPARRFTSMREAVAALAAVGAPPRWQRWAAVAAAGGLVVAVGLVVPTPRPADACSDGAGLADDLWTPVARSQLVATFAQVRPHGAVAIASSAHVVDEWVAAWRLGRRAACKLDGELRSSRLACLDQGLHDLRAQLAVWRRPDGEIVDRVLATATALPPPDACAAARDRPAIDPEIRERYAGVLALARSGRPRDARPAALDLVRIAEATGNPAVEAPAYYTAGLISRDTGELEAARTYLTRAASAAGRAGMDAQLLDALILEASVVVDQGRPLDSLGILDAAAAIIARVGGDRLPAGDRPDKLARVRGDALTMAGRVVEGIAELRRAVTLLEQRAARDPAARLELTRGMAALAHAYNEHFEWAKAHELLSRALAIDEAALGAVHPGVARTLHDLATNASRLGRFDEAIAGLERARKIFVTTYGERHATVGGTDISLALTASEQRRYDAARAYYQRGLAVLRAVLPADHPHLAVASEGLGTIDREQGRCAEAIPHFERALAILERIGRGGPDLATQLMNLGACLAEVGRRAEARPMIERSLALLDAAGVADKSKAEQWAALAELELHAGHRAKAIALARQVLATTSDDDGPQWVGLRAYVREQLAAWTR